MLLQVTLCCSNSCLFTVAKEGPHAEPLLVLSADAVEKRTVFLSSLVTAHKNKKFFNWSASLQGRG